MENQTKISLAIVAVSVIILGAIVYLAGTAAKVTKTASETPDASIGWSKGPEDAKVTVIEFSDFQCPVCMEAQPVINQMLKDYDGKVRFVYRHYPLPQHQNADEAAEAAEAAGAAGKFFEYGNKLFDKQDEWDNLKDPTDYFASLGKEMGIDENSIRNAIKNKQYENTITRDMNAGDKAGITGTPTFFINGEQKTGMLTIDEWKQLIDAKLSE